MFVPDRIHIYGTQQPVTGIASLFFAGDFRWSEHLILKSDRIYSEIYFISNCILSVAGSIEFLWSDDKQSNY
jgi:hypothetical protein